MINFFSTLKNSYLTNWKILTSVLSNQLRSVIFWLSWRNLSRTGWFSASSMLVKIYILMFYLLYPDKLSDCNEMGFIALILKLNQSLFKKVFWNHNIYHSESAKWSCVPVKFSSVLQVSEVCKSPTFLNPIWFPKFSYYLEWFKCPIAL